MREVLIFLDLEANQELTQKGEEHTTIHKLLQLSALKIVNGRLHSKFNKYCHYEGRLNDKVRHLLCKNQRFFMNQKEDEKAVYLSFQKFCGKKAKIYCYGNYDQIILDSVMQNNGLQKRIELIDFADIIIKRYGLNNKLTPSQENLCNIFDIHARKKHNALNDAFALWLIYKNVNKAKDDKPNINRLYNELLRPKNDRLQIPFFKKIENQELDDDYFYIFNKTKLTNRYELINEVKTIIGYHLHVELYIYNNQRKLEDMLIQELDFDNKKEAEEHMYMIYVSSVFDKIKNSVVIYDTGQKSEIGITKNYKKFTQNIIPYYLVVSNKVEAHKSYFNKSFDTPEAEHKYIMNSVRKFYDKETKSFNRILK